ncbi:MAG: dodecin domain-containing protein [Gemmatimonadetes bacterium]|nr:dodecin domain-containing protein [Gemmatimonadota bacterium]
MKHQVAKVIEVVGTSEEGWTQAADEAVRVASKSVKHITGIQVGSMTAQVRDGKISAYKTTVKIAFGVND